MKLLLIIILVYLFFRILVRYILPWMVRRYIKKAREKFYRQNPHFDHHEQKKEGEMTISIKRTKHSKPDTDKIGDYTDYEEIKDDQ